MGTLLTAPRRLGLALVAVVVERGLVVLEDALWDGGEDPDAAMPARAAALSRPA